LLKITAVVLMWGSAFPLVKLSLSEVPPLTLGLIRFLVAAPIMATYAYLKLGCAFNSYFNKAAPLILMGLTGIAGYQVLQNLGVNLTTATSSSIIIASNPIMLAALSSALLGEKLNTARAVGVAVGFIGVVMVILAGGSLGSSSLLGDALSMGAAFSWAVYSIVGRKLAMGCDSTGLTAASMIFGTIILTPVACLLERPRLPYSFSVWAAVLTLGLGASCLAYYLWNQLLSEVEASRLGVALYAVPVISSILSTALLSETPSALMLSGLLLVVAGISVTQKAP
jgi:drug/metabolite transporter (DMT)-like permease